MNRIVFMIALILGMSSGPQSQANPQSRAGLQNQAEPSWFHNMFLLHSIEIAGVVGPDQQKYDGTCDKKVPDATDYGDNRAHSLDQALLQPQVAPFDVYFIGACDTPMTFNYANLIPSADWDPSKFQLELGVIDYTSTAAIPPEIHRVIVNAPCAVQPTPGSPIGNTELICTVSGARGSGTITFVSPD